MSDLEDKSRQEGIEKDLFFDLVPDMLCIASVEDGYFKKLNPAWEKTLGFTVEELLSKPLVEFICPDDRVSTMSEVDKQLKGQSTAHFENRYICKDGSYRWLAWTAAPAKGNLLFATARDITDQKLAEEKLRRSKILLESSIESPKDMIILSLDSEYRYLYFNKTHSESMGHVYGTTPRIGDCIFDHMKSKDDIEKVKSHYDRAMAGEGHVVIEEYGEGQVRYCYEVRYNPIYDEKNEIMGLTAYAHNITERNKTEEALQQSEERLQTLIHSIRTGVVVYAADTSILQSNIMAQKLLGLNEAQMLNKKAMDPRWKFIRNDGSNMPLEEYPINQVIATQKILEDFVLGVYYPETDDVAWLLVNAVPEFDQKSDLARVIVTFVNITERKKMEDAFQESEERFRMMMHQSPSVIELYDSDGLQIEVNEAYEELWGFPASHTVKKFNVLKSKEVEETGLMTYVIEAYAGESVKVPEYKFDSTGATEGKGKGRIRWLSTRIYPLKDREDNVKNIVITHEDISDIKFAEEERVKLKEELQHSQKIESIGVLAGGIAHDFNNLLSIILNNLYMVKAKIDYKSNAYSNMTDIETAIQRATDLTHQLLTFSRGGAPVKKTASIIQIIDESAEFVLRGSNVNCEYKIIENLWSVEVDKGQMNQVIHNLILNADQSMPEGGTIRIYAENVDLSSGTGLPLKEGIYIKIAIQDQGIGISAEHLQKLFDPYFTTKEMGRGLGLSIIYSIIKQHDGHISAKSELEIGTTFTIYLPASEKQVEETEVAENAPAAGEGKILIMDDEELIRESLGELLTMNGFEVEYAKDGEEAIDLYQNTMKTSEPFDAVILDLTIRGGMGGKETVKKLLEIDPDARAIVSSGYSNDPVMANYKEYGFSDVYCKASDSPDDLSRILNKVIKE